VDPALIELFLEGLQVCDLLQYVPDAVLITILVDTKNNYFLVTSEYDAINFEHLPDGYVDLETYPNILHIGNGVPGESPEELASYYETLENQGE
jgi:hypothetical protein